MNGYETPAPEIGWSARPGAAAALLVVVVLVTLVIVTVLDALLGREAAVTLGSIEPKYLIAGGAMAAGAVGAIALAGSLERGLFLLFVISVPVRAVLRLGDMPSNIEILLGQYTGSGNPGWIGYPFGQLSIALSDVPLAMLWLLAMPGLVTRSRRFPWWLFAGAALFILAEVMSVAAARQPALAAWAVVETVKAVAGAAYVVYRTRSRRDFEFCLDALTIALALQAAIAVAQYLTDSTLGLTFSGLSSGAKLEGGILRTSGTFPHPQMLAMYVGMFLPLLVAIALLQQSFWRRAVRVIVAVAGSVALILTFSRMGWLAGTAGTAFVVATTGLSSRHHRQMLRASVLLLVALVATMPLWAIIAQNLTIERAGSELDIIADLYRVAYTMIQARPLDGVGINNFSLVMGQYDRTGISVFYPAPIHNIFMLALAEMGPLGLIGLLAVVAVPAAGLWRARRRLDDAGRGYVAGLFGGLLAFCLLGLTGWTYYVVQTPVWLFFGTAMAAASGSLNQREQT